MNAWHEKMRKKEKSSKMLSNESGKVIPNLVYSGVI
jgi:hypothetical protein